MNNQVLIARRDVVRDQRQLAEQMSAEVKCYKNLFHLAFVLLKDMHFMKAIEYGLSNLISSLKLAPFEEEQTMTNFLLFKERVS